MKILSGSMLLTASFVLFGCSGNVFEGVDKPAEKNNLESASRALEDGNPEKAIKILLAMLPDSAANIVTNSDPTDPAYEANLAAAVGDIDAHKEVLAALARAYPEKQGVNLLDMAARLNAAQKSKTALALVEEDDPVTTFMQLVPDALAGDNRSVGIPDLNRGISIANIFLSSCQADVDSATPCAKQDVMITAIVNMVGFAASLKSYDDSPENGSITAEEAGDIPFANGAEAYRYAKSASLRLGNYSDLSPNSADITKAKCKFDDAISKIEAQTCIPADKTSDECIGEKLVHYLVCTSDKSCSVASCNG